MFVFEVSCWTLQTFLLFITLSNKGNKKETDNVPSFPLLQDCSKPFCPALGSLPRAPWTVLESNPAGIKPEGFDRRTTWPLGSVPAFLAPFTWPDSSATSATDAGRGSCVTTTTPSWSSIPAAVQKETAMTITGSSGSNHRWKVNSSSNRILNGTISSAFNGPASLPLGPIRIFRWGNGGWRRLPFGIPGKFLSFWWMVLPETAAHSGFVFRAERLLH